MEEIYNKWNEVKKEVSKNKRKLGIKPRGFFGQI